MKKTFLAISLVFLGMACVRPSHAQELKADDANFPEPQQSRGSFTPKERNLVQATSERKPLAADPRVRQTAPSPSATPNSALRRRPELPAVRSPRAQTYVVSRGSNKTRKQAQSHDMNPNASPNVKTVVTTTVGPLEIVRNGPTSSKGALRTGPGAIRMPLTVPNRSFDGERVIAKSKAYVEKRALKPKPPTQSSSASPYAASYGAYDQNAKKKRNY